MLKKGRGKEICVEGADVVLNKATRRRERYWKAGRKEKGRRGAKRRVRG